MECTRRCAFRQLVDDVAIQMSLGRFFAAKLRSGLCFALWQQGKNRKAGEQAISAYTAARDAWAEMAQRAKRLCRTSAMAISSSDPPIGPTGWRQSIRTLPPCTFAVAAAPVGRHCRR